MAVFGVSFRDGVIDQIHAIVHPDKLSHAGSVLDLPTFPPGKQPRGE